MLKRIIVGAISAAVTLYALNIMALPTGKPKQKPKPTDSLMCLGKAFDDHDVMMVYMDAPRRELLVNGEVHRLVDFAKFKDGMALYTDNFSNIEGKESYIALASINSGAQAGIYVTLYNTTNDWPESVILLKCKRVNLRRA